MNDANRAYKIDNIKVEIILVQGWYKKIDGINIEKNLEKGWSKTKTVEKIWKKINYTVGE